MSVKIVISCNSNLIFRRLRIIKYCVITRSINIKAELSLQLLNRGQISDNSRRIADNSIIKSTVFTQTIVLILFGVGYIIIINGQENVDLIR